MFATWKKSYEKPRKHIKSRDITLPTKVHLVKAMVFPVALHGCELDYKESWASKNWWFWTVVLEKTLESLVDCKEIQPVHPKGNQSWVFTGRIDVESETSILCHLMQRADSLEQTLMLGKIEGSRRRGWQKWMTDGWMASPTQWTRVWVNSRSW